MYHSHDGLKNKYEVSCSELDFLVNCTIGNNDVLGSRMMGGGFGGCTINLIKRGAVNKFIDELSPVYQKEFGRLLKTYVVKIGDGARVEILK
jgi:galactokinase